ncbi:MAG: V-type sodium ATPase subunit D [candidate division WS2 bacterium]|uniref:V-type ATP synthase subunit D n=1 Tax=Psychracetigena formicireducens TaxID=2986056 RepID=A0A9E2BHK0_PSYF1|nr:V-type sodium ATPase subunit D [Candidatus Psychracetigena formicireducens]MBT9144726.1 V-type sodium ATPase subunit D [Candidatus Psychracetigena formicireducens]
MININPNRMELLRLKRRLAVARRGHRLLRDKLEGLMKEFIKLSKEYIRIRREVDAGLKKVMQAMILAEASMAPQALPLSILTSASMNTLKKAIKRIMGVKIPSYEVDLSNFIISYGFVFTTSSLDEAVENIKELFTKLVRLAEVEIAIKIMIKEIARTKRRVNALEHVLIPQMEETSRYITFRLDEMDRSNISRLTRIKEIIRKES